MIELYGHPFSSYTWKVLIALYELETRFAFRSLEEPANAAAWAALFPLRKMPVMVDGERTVIGTDAIVEYLDATRGGAAGLLPEADRIEVRMMTRIFDDYVMTPMQTHVADALRSADARDPHGVAEAAAQLDAIYPWLDERLTGRCWTAGDAFTLADCAAAPALFYADWVRPISAELTTLRSHRAKLLAHPSVARCVEDARPYRSYFPLGAPDRD